MKIHSRLAIKLFSRMKTDDTTLAAGYSAIGGFNLRQLIRHLLGKDIKPMG
jgi:hypothetical protein